MDSKQRILTALSNAQPDKVPIYENLINEPILIDLARILGVNVPKSSPKRGLILGEGSHEILDLYCLLIRELGLDSTNYDFSIGLEAIDNDYGRDKYGRVYRLSEHGDPIVVEGPIKEASDIKGYDMVSKLRADDFTKVQYIIDEAGRDKAHCMSVPDPFKTSWLLRGGMQGLFIDYILNPKLVHALARISTDFSIAAIGMAAKIGVDVIVLEGDLAGERYTLISPEHYQEYVKPYEKEIVDFAHRKELKIAKHSDGNVWPLLEDFVEVGFDGFHPVQPQCMEIAKVKERLTGEACVIGNIDCRYLLPFGTVEEVEEAVKKTIEEAAPGGGYIISSSNSIHPGCKAENYVAMLEAVHKYGVYDEK